MELYQEQSCLALQAVGRSIQTMLGPNKTLKCYISAQGDSGLLGDTMQVLDALMASYCSAQTSRSRLQQNLNSQQQIFKEHEDPSPDRYPGNAAPPPVLQFLYEACLEQKRRVGCGVTTLVCMTAYWAPEILSLIKLGLPLSFVFGVFHEALDMCKEHMKSVILHTVSVSRTIPASDVTYKTAPLHHVSRPAGHMTNPTGNEIGKCNQTPLPRHHSEHNISKRQQRVLSYSKHFTTLDGKGKDTLCTSVEELRTSRNQQSVAQLNTVECLHLCGGREEAMRLAMEAWLIHSAGDRSPEWTSTSTSLLKLPLQYIMVGKSRGNSRVVRGVVTDLHSDLHSTAQSLDGKESNMLILEGDCLPGYRHLGLQQDYGHVISHDISQLQERGRSRKWLDSVLSALEKFEVKILVVGGAVSPLLWEQCVGRDILVMKNMPAKMRTALSDMTGARPISYFSQCSPKVLASCVKAEVLEAGWAKPPPNFSQHKTRSSRSPIRSSCCRLYQDSPCSDIATVLLCGSSEVEVNNLQHQFQNCYHRLHWASSPSTSTSPSSSPSQAQPSLVPGGGRVEASCIAMLEDVIAGKDSTRCRSSSLPLYFTSRWSFGKGLEGSGDASHWRTLVHQAFVDGLRQFVARTLINATPGVEKFEALCVVEDLVKCRGNRREECRAIDVGVVKEGAWSRAVGLLEAAFKSTRVSRRT